MLHLLPTRLRGRLLVLLGFAVLTPILVLGGVAIVQRRHAEQDARLGAERMVRIATLQHRRTLAAARQLVVSLSRLPVVQQRDPAACSALFAGLLGDFPTYSAIAAAGPDGRVFAGVGDIGPGLDLSDRPWLARARAGRRFTIGVPRAPIERGEPPALVCAAPASGADGTVTAVVMASLRLDWLEATGEDLRLLPEGTLTVFDDDGEVLARYPDGEHWVGRRLPEAGLLRMARALGRGQGEAAGPDGRVRLFAFAPLAGAPERPLWVAVGASRDAAFAPARRTFVRSLMVLALFGIALMLVAWHAARLIVLRHVEALLAATRDLASGHYAARVQAPHSRSELGELARAFDDMARSLERRLSERDHAERALRESEARKGAILAAAPDGIVTLDPRGAVIELNPAAERMLGIRREEVLGEDLGALVLPHDLHRRLLDDMAEFTRGGASPLGGEPVETQARRADGAEFPVRVRLNPVVVPDAPAAFLLYLQDLTEAVRHAEALRALSLVDELTGLYNRRGFLTFGAQHMRVATRGGLHLLLLFADLDNLKEINDGYGHGEGDRALVEAARVLRRTFRESDVIARVGGDEFAVLAFDAAGRGAPRARQRLTERIESNNRKRGRAWSLEMSVGVAHWDPTQARSIEELLADGDANMYREKRARREARTE